MWEYDKAIGPEVQRILGNVIFRHDSTWLYCDSAYLNEEKNTVHAFGNVHVKASDTLNLFGDSLRYDGNTKVAKFKSNVKLVDNQTILTTDTLVYDRKTRIAQYDYWGKIVNDKNILVSKHGYYYTDRKEFFFKEKVIMINPDHIMHSDTLKYNTVTEVSWFFGPSTIVSKDKEDSIYCENGWYNTRYDQARFSKRAKIYHKEQFLTGDSLYYERKNGFGQAFRHAFLFDTLQNVALTGNYGEIRRREGFAFMTDSAMAIIIEKKKDSLFLHSDTIRGTFDDNQNIKNVFAFYRAKFYRSDLQGMCDSMVYHGPDSTFFMYHEPVIWSEKNQLTGDTVSLTLRNGQLDSMVFYNSAFIISMDDTNKFNQIKGRNMIAHFLRNQLYRIRILGNAETIYFTREDDRSLIGINKAVSSDMLIFLDDNKLKSITYIGEPSAVLYPEKDVSPYDLRLRNFRWLEQYRPRQKSDIFKREVTLPAKNQEPGQ